MSAVFLHHAQRCRIIAPYPQIELFFSDKFLRFFQAQTQSFCSVSLPAFIPCYGISDMPRSVPQCVCQTAAHPEFTDDAVIIPQKEEDFRDMPFRQIFAPFILFHPRQSSGAEVFKRYSRPLIGKSILVSRNTPHKLPLRAGIFRIRFFQFQHYFSPAAIPIASALVFTT